MAGRCYVLTGAGSHLGMALARVLVRDEGARVVGLVRGSHTPPTSISGIEYVAQDLTAPLSAAAERVLLAADCVVHLAWSRAGTPDEIAADNAAMLDRLLAVPEVGAKLLFVSSVAASPRARSAYGRAKFAVQQRVATAGGAVLVCGLVVGEPAQGGFKTLVDALARLPMSIRFVPDDVRVYPVVEADLVELLAALARGPRAAVTYRGFLAGGVSLNRFIDWTAQRYGVAKVRLPVPRFAVTAAMLLSRVLRLRRLSEKLATFFFKDASVLDGLAEPPGATLRATQRQFEHELESR